MNYPNRTLTWEVGGDVVATAPRFIGWLSLLVVLLSWTGTIGVLAQPSEEQVPSSPDVANSPEPADDGWNFEDDDTEDDPWAFDEDEETVETWGVLLVDQAADLTFFTVFATLTLVGFFRKSVWLKYVTLSV
ncbi:MAG: hypothetical protein VYE68_00180, partial [Acidobacteriota bacterium]|nr:hypothetical protein [Acidobacteriota bacterium]